MDDGDVWQIMKWWVNGDVMGDGWWVTDDGWWDDGWWVMGLCPQRKLVAGNVSCHKLRERWKLRLPDVSVANRVVLWAAIGKWSIVVEFMTLGEREPSSLARDDCCAGDRGNIGE